MGGRGANGGFGQGAGSGQRQPASQTLEDYLGPKGPEMDHAQAAQGANPHFLESYQNRDKLYTHNCQRCVWAVELRRRGYDLEAMARTSDDTYASMDTSNPHSFLNVADTPIQLEKFGSYWRDAGAREVTDSIKSYGEGARGMLIMQSYRRRSGHVCNWEVKNGKAIIYDGQSNRTYSMTELKKSGFGVFYTGRMDDKGVTDLVRDFVKRSGT